MSVLSNALEVFKELWFYRGLINKEYSFDQNDNLMSLISNGRGKVLTLIAHVAVALCILQSGHEVTDFPVLPDLDDAVASLAPRLANTILLGWTHPLYP